MLRLSGHCNALAYNLPILSPNWPGLLQRLVWPPAAAGKGEEARTLRAAAGGWPTPPPREKSVAERAQRSATLFSLGGGEQHRQNWKALLQRRCMLARRHGSRASIHLLLSDPHAGREQSGQVRQFEKTKKTC